LAKRRTQAHPRWDIAPRAFAYWPSLTPPQLFVASFALLVMLGTLGFKFLPGLYQGPGLSWLDACFMSTSAVCITGLAVVDVETYFTFAGQAYVLLLVQLGGLGMLTFTSLIMIALGRRLSLHEESLAGSIYEVTPHIDAKRLLVDVARFTFTMEGIGALLLYLFWIPRLGFAGALWPAIFHSVTAFCNAGFSTFRHNLVDHQQNYPVLVVIMALIIAGGIGFLTMEEFYLLFKARRQQLRLRLSLHSRLVIVTTIGLTLSGWLLLCVFEWKVGLKDMSVPGKVVNGLFMSVTARSAGFNSIDYTTASDSGNFLTILLMTIGGSPGSTAGGIKTTTFAILALLAWSQLRGYTHATFAGRSLRETTTDRAIAMFVISSGIVVIGVFLLLASEHFHSGPGRFLPWMFEAVSAFNTAGMTMGATHQLSSLGRVLIILLMFVGRIGPLTIASAVSVRRTGERGFRFAYEEVMVD
jgi:trk system potassium uptake protein TrkH